MGEKLKIFLRFCLALLIVAFIGAVAVSLYQNASFIIPGVVMDTAGSPESSNAQFRGLNIVGQPAPIGASSNASFQNFMGYLYTFSPGQIDADPPDAPTIDAVRSPTPALAQHITGTMAEDVADISVNGVYGDVVLNYSENTWAYDATLTYNPALPAGTPNDFTFIAKDEADNESGSVATSIIVKEVTAEVQGLIQGETPGTVLIEIPVGVTAVDTYISIEAVADPPDPPLGSAVVSFAVDLAITDSQGNPLALDEPITVTMSISAEGENWRYVEPRYYDAATYTWKDDGITVIERTESYVKFTITHATVFMVFAPADTTPPVISDLTFDGQTIQNNDYIAARAQISADVSDTGGSGIDASTIELKINDVVVIHTYTVTDADNGTVAYQPTTDLTDGTHTLTLDVSDQAGNPATQVSATFIVASGVRVKDVINFPNPADPTTGPVYIGYNLSQDVEITIYIVDLNGRIVLRRSYISGSPGARTGYNEVSWAGMYETGGYVPNGIYLYRIVTARTVLGKGKIAILK